ncbi:MAG: beta-eliminating lyase-related protein [Oscillospiraceae bacterium]|nr:beta-eliminating lyase-related protein [Oscillospiraceae bacterium]
MIYFDCDYAEGAHPKILERLMETNDEQTQTYGEDGHCAKAAELIKHCCVSPSAAVHFFTGGTQANLTVIGALLRPYQGVIASVWGHIGEHETGAIEATGHKVLTVANDDGKITAAQIDELCRAHKDDPSHEHIVQPGMVYISHPTEYGTLYTKPELEAIRRVCDIWELPLYMDGARMGYGIAAAAQNLAAGERLMLPDIAVLCDVFYVGGTKVGAMFGEAVVITCDEFKKDFRYYIKQRGGLLAKGRMLGIQFEVLFEGGHYDETLYNKISDHAILMAGLIRKACVDKGYGFLCETYANQVFPILPEHVIAELREKYVFLTWAAAGEINGERHYAVRLCTSWATKEENVAALTEDIATIT